MEATGLISTCIALANLCKIWRRWGREMAFISLASRSAQRHSTLDRGKTTCVHFHQCGICSKAWIYVDACCYVCHRVAALLSMMPSKKDISRFFHGLIKMPSKIHTRACDSTYIIYRFLGISIWSWKCMVVDHQLPQTEAVSSSDMLSRASTPCPLSWFYDHHIVICLLLRADQSPSR